MRPMSTSALASAGLLALAWAGAGPGGPEAGGRRTPVIVELFTSQGCSSCPPADALLADLVREQPVPGAEIVALEEHVDYWNHLGWADPFSSAEFTRRQRLYADAFGLGSIYTPQMVVGGTREFVGGDRGKAVAAIAAASAGARAVVRIRILPPPKPSGAATPPGGEPDAARGRGLRVPLGVTVEPDPGRAPLEPFEMWLAITEGGLSTAVGGGENEGRQLSHSAVVRTLVRIGGKSDRPGDRIESTVEARLESAWSRPDLRAVVFVQAKGNGAVLGAASISLAPPA
jgi:hypothetical protein